MALAVRRSNQSAINLIPVMVDLVEFLAWLVFLLVEKMVATTRKKRRKLKTIRRRTGRWKSRAGRPPLRDTKHSPTEKKKKEELRN